MEVFICWSPDRRSIHSATPLMMSFFTLHNPLLLYPQPAMIYISFHLPFLWHIHLPYHRHYLILKLELEKFATSFFMIIKLTGFWHDFASELFDTGVRINDDFKVDHVQGPSMISLVSSQTKSDFCSDRRNGFKADIRCICMIQTNGVYGEDTRVLVHPRKNSRRCCVRSRGFSWNI